MKKFILVAMALCFGLSVFAEQYKSDEHYAANWNKYVIEKAGREAFAAQSPAEEVTKSEVNEQYADAWENIDLEKKGILVFPDKLTKKFEIEYVDDISFGENAISSFADGFIKDYQHSIISDESLYSPFHNDSYVRCAKLLNTGNTVVCLFSNDKVRKMMMTRAVAYTQFGELLGSFHIFTNEPEVSKLALHIKNLDSHSVAGDKNFAFFAHSYDKIRVYWSPDDYPEKANYLEYLLMEKKFVKEVISEGFNKYGINTAVIAITPKNAKQAVSLITYELAKAQFFRDAEFKKAAMDVLEKYSKNPKTAAFISRFTEILKEEGYPVADNKELAARELAAHMIMYKGSSYFNSQAEQRRNQSMKEEFEVVGENTSKDSEHLNLLSDMIEKEGNGLTFDIKSNKMLSPQGGKPLSFPMLR